jgi:hypothetical protein
MIRIALLSTFAAVTLVAAQEPAYTVTFREPQTEVANIVQPVEPNPRIQYQYTGMMAFGLTVDQNIMLCCGAGAIRTNFKVDNLIRHPNIAGMGTPLPPDRTGKPRRGIQASYQTDGMLITQMLEIIPSKSTSATGKRQLDTVLIKYLVENRDMKPHEFGARVRIDTMCGNNDGALFAAPQTHPGEILDGIELKGKTLPEYVQILQNPDLKNPGFVGHFTLKLPGNRVGPDRFICTCHRFGDNGWEPQIQKAMGDSDCVLMWSPRTIRPSEKVEFAYAYGKGIASLPESEGRVKLTLGGNFEPGKLFTVQASVEEPAVGQTLAIELPPGMTLVEGSSVQPIAPATETLATGMVIWRARVDRPGDFSFRVRSSNGITETRSVSVKRT